NFEPVASAAAGRPSFTLRLPVELYLQRYHDLISKKEILNRSWGEHQIFGAVAGDL
ncbi:hypothetical protein PIB30_101823, partial [Stylosanthes scabra]|nr:hypothetical protein [Stylosanthes scabra]